MVIGQDRQDTRRDETTENRNICGVVCGLAKGLGLSSLSLSFAFVLFLVLLNPSGLRVSVYWFSISLFFLSKTNKMF